MLLERYQQPDHETLKSVMDGAGPCMRQHRPRRSRKQEPLATVRVADTAVYYRYGSA